MDARQEFLHKMYEQMFRDISQQLNTVWQAVTVVFGSFAILALSEKGILPVDFAVAIVLGLCGWFILTIIECGYWYNRNLAIIANIERQFLNKEDLSEISYYFGKHRPHNKMIGQLIIQNCLAIFLASVVLAYHFSQRVLPGLGQSQSSFDPIRALPYFVAGALLIGILRFTFVRNGHYKEFLRNSPGIAVDTTGINYGPGHGHNS